MKGHRRPRGATLDHDPVGRRAQVAVVTLRLGDRLVPERFQLWVGGGDQSNEAVEIGQEVLLLMVTDLAVQLGNGSSCESCKGVGKESEEDAGLVERLRNLFGCGGLGLYGRRGAIEKKE